MSLWQDRDRLEGGCRLVAADRKGDRQREVPGHCHDSCRDGVGKHRQRMAVCAPKGVIVYPVKGVPDEQLDYDSLPGWMRKVHFFDLANEWTTFVNYLKSDRQPQRVPFMAPQLPANFVQRPHEFEQLVAHVLQPERKEPLPSRPRCTAPAGTARPRSRRRSATTHGSSTPSTTESSGCRWGRRRTCSTS